MKVTFFISALLLFNCLSGQIVNHPDSLKKYSYFILGFNSKRYGKPYGGTGFFIRSHGKLFFVTASHVFNGCGDDNKKEYGYPEIMNVTIQDINRNFISVLSIDIKKIIDSVDCNKADSIDAIVVEVNPPDSVVNKIYSVEKFIRPPFKSLSHLVMFGFPIKVIDYATIGDEKPSSVVMKFPDTRYAIRTIPGTKIVDSINIYVYNQKEKIDSLKGFSGAPVFIKDSLSNNWRIWGVFAKFGYEKPTMERFILFPSIDYIKGELDRLK